MDRRIHEAEPVAVASEPSGDRVGVRRLTVGEHHDEAGIGPRCTQNRPVVLLQRPEVSEAGRGLVAQVDGPTAGRRLGWPGFSTRVQARS